MSRVFLAIRSFFAILFRGRLPDNIAAALGLVKARPQPVPAPAPAATASDGALQILSILQRDSRLVDFLMEDISGYSDEQVGAAVRGLHNQCRESLARYVRLAPVIDGVEGTYSRVEATESPAAVKFVGNVPMGGHPQGGLLRHKGWRAARIDLPSLPRGHDPAVVAPAEIEIE